MGHIGNKLLSGLIHRLQFSEGLADRFRDLLGFPVGVHSDILLQISLCHSPQHLFQPDKRLQQQSGSQKSKHSHHPENHKLEKGYLFCHPGFQQIDIFC